MPFYYTPGNHDINSLETKAIWKERYGRPYYHFLYNDCLFLVLNNEDYTRKEFAQMVHNQQLGLKQDPAYLKAWEHYLATIQPGPRIYPRPRPGDLVAGTGNTAALSAEQLAYFENALRENPDVRWTFVFMHQPLWSGGGAQSWQALESLLLDRPYTAFAGHEHTYQYNEVNDRIHIRLGTTGGGMGATGFDHFLWVTLTRDGPVFANLVLDGVLDQYGRIPAGGENLEFRK